MSIVGIGLLMGLVVWIAQVYDAYNAWKTGNAWGNKLTGQESRFTGDFFKGEWFFKLIAQITSRS